MTSSPNRRIVPASSRTPNRRRHDADAGFGPPTSPRLWLRLVGEFTVYREGRILPAREIGSRKARTVLALLAIDSHQFVLADQLIDALWNGSPPRRPEANIATLVSRMRTALGPDAIIGRRTGYRLGDSVSVDLDHAADLMPYAERLTIEGKSVTAHQTATRALSLLDETLVVADQPHAWWADVARRRHVWLLRRARHAAAESALRLGNALAAMAPSQAAIDADPLDEAACRFLMRAHDNLGEPAGALGAYERLRTALARDYGTDPAPLTQALHMEILRRRVSQLSA